MYELKLWNGKEGKDTSFVVKDTKSGKYGVLNSANPKDIVWVSEDLTKAPEYSKWQDFKNEKVDDLSLVVM